MNTATQYGPETKKERVAEAIRELIITGVYEVGDALPSLETFTEQAAELIGVSVSPGTVRDGETILAESGVLAEPQQGTATKVLRGANKVYGDWVSPVAMQARTQKLSEPMAVSVPTPRQGDGLPGAQIVSPGDRQYIAAVVPDDSLIGAILAWERKLVARIEALEARAGA